MHFKVLFTTAKMMFDLGLKCTSSFHEKKKVFFYCRDLKKFKQLEGWNMSEVA